MVDVKTFICAKIPTFTISLEIILIRIFFKAFFLLSLASGQIFESKPLRTVLFSNITYIFVEFKYKIVV